LYGSFLALAHHLVLLPAQLVCSDVVSDRRLELVSVWFPGDIFKAYRPSLTLPGRPDRRHTSGEMQMCHME